MSSIFHFLNKLIVYDYRNLVINMGDIISKSIFEGKSNIKNLTCFFSTLVKKNQPVSTTEETYHLIEIELKKLNINKIYTPIVYNNNSISENMTFKTKVLNNSNFELNLTPSELESITEFRYYSSTRNINKIKYKKVHYSKVNQIGETYENVNWNVAPSTLVIPNVKYSFKLEIVLN